MADKFDGYFAQRDANEAAKAGQIALQSPRTPDQALQQMDVGRELGMPAYAVGADPEFYSSLVSRKRMTTALSGAPKTAQWMQNPDNADLVKDDVASIGFIESLGNSFIRWDQRTGQSFAQWQSNAARQRGADQGRSIGEIAWDERQPLRDAEGRELGREFLGVGGLASTANRFLTSRLSAALGIDEGESAVDWQLDASEFARTAASVPMTSRAAAVRDKLGAFDASKPWQTQLVEFANLVGEDPAGFWSFLAQVGAESAPNMGVAALGMAITKSPVVAAATSGAMSGATEYGTEPLKWLEDQRINVTKPDGLAYALSQAAQVYGDGILSGVQGVINAASEGGFDLSKPEGMAELAAAIVGESGLGMDDIEGAREGVEFLKSSKLDLSTREGVLAAFSDPALMAEAERRGELRGMIIGALDGISGGVAGNALAKSPMMNLLVQGFAQSAMGAGGEALAQAAVGDEINLAEVLVEGLAEFAMAPVEVAAMGGGKAPNMIRRFTGSGKTASVLDELGQAAAGSKLRARSPDKFLEALNAQGLDDALISVPASAVREYFQSLGFDPQNPDLEIIEAWGVSLDGWLAAEASDGDILVPASNYAANLVGTPAADVVLRHGSLDPDAEMSLSDAELFNAEWRDVMEAELAQIEEQRRWDESLQSDSDMIRESIRSQLREAGQSQTAADAAGELWASAIVTAAERSGKSAAELWDRYQVRVVGEATAAEVRRRGALDASLNVIRSKGRKEAASPAQRAQQERKRLVEQYPELKSKRPFTKALQARGGIAPTIMRDGQEVPSPAAEALAAMGVTPKNAVGLFRKGGMTDLDNIPASEIFLSPVIGFDEATGYLQPDAIYDAIAREAAGEQVPYSAEAVAARDALAALEADVSALGDAAAQPAGASYSDRFGDTDVADLARALDAAGLDLSVMDNDAVAAALGMGDMRAANFATGQDAQGRQFDQASPQSDAFKAWFGDSKVVDADGNPLVVYHGTAIDGSTMFTPAGQLPARAFDRFDPEMLGSVTDASDARAGFWFSAGRDRADAAAADAKADRGGSSYVYEVYLSIENPLVLEDVRDYTPQEVADIAADAKAEGRDGIIFSIGEMGEADYLVFSPEQIKSVNNRGTWDAGDPRMLFQSAPAADLRPTAGFDGSEGATPYDVRNHPDFMVKAEAYARAGLESVAGFQRRAAAKMFSDDGAFSPSDDDLAKVARIAAANNMKLQNPSVAAPVVVPVPAIVDEGDYRMTHRAPSAADGVAAHDLTGSYPEDFYARDGFRIYADQGKAYDRKTYNLVKALRGKPDVSVKIFRSVPKGVTEINRGDWVSLTHEYAVDHGDANLKDGYDILEMDVPARDLFTNGDSLDEWGWSPEGKTYFQTDKVGQNDARGRVSFPAGGIGTGQTVIDLFQKQNLSTFLHESGHVFLEIYADLARDPNAPADIKDMMGSVREWLGSEPDAEFTTDQHEKFARGFEAFLMEGKAPSLELLDAFTRFKSWLVHIYKSVKALRVNVTPKIADVMERMVATDAAIVEARQTLDVGPMFAERGPAGMSQQDWETYQKVAQRETDEASAKLLKRTMDKIRRETQAWFKEAKEQTQKDVLRDFSARRNFRLVSALSNKRWPDPANTSPVPDMQIDRAALVEIYGDGILEELGKARLGGGRAIYTRKGVSGTSPQIVAEMFGYRSVMEMVEELQNTPKFNDAVRAEVDRRLVEEHGDPLSDGTIEDLAIAALHNEAKGQRDMIELRSMARRLGRVDPRQRQIKARAKMLHGALSVREASNPNAFLRAERKAAREAQASFAAVVRGGAGARESLEAAYAAKEREVLNSYLYQEARAFEKALRSARDRFRGYSSGRVRQAIGSPHIEQIDALLEGYDFKTKTQKAVNRQESLKRYIDAMMAAGREAELTLDPEVMARADDIHYSRMKVSEFYGLNDMVRNIEHLGRLKGKLLTKQRERSEAAVVDAIRVELANMKGKPRSREKDAKFSRSRLGRAVLNWTLNADTLLREIDGFKHMGAAWDGIKRGIDEGLSRLTQRKTIMAQRFDELFSVYTDAEKRDMANKRPNGVLGGDFSKWAIITIALNTGNRDNFQRLTNEKVNGSFTEAQVNQALSALDERDWRFVQSLIDYINEFWPDIAAKEKRVTGVSPKKVEAEVMTTAAPSWFTGGYYPIKYDGELSARADDLTQAQMADALRGGRSGKAQTAKGHTKERLTSATQPINLDIGLSMQHVNDVLYDLELGEEVAASWRILAKLKDDFWSKGKHEDYAALESWLKDVGAGERTAAHGWGRIMQSLRSGFAFSRLALNLVTVALQPTGIAQSFVVVGKADMARGIVKFASNPSRWANDITSASPFMAERQKTFQRDIHNIIGNLDTSSMTGGRWQKLQRDYIVPLSFYLMQKVQFYTVDAPTWIAAYDQERARGGSEDKARVFADLMVKRAQGSGLLSDRGMLERGKFTPSQEMNEMPKLLTALGSYMFAKFNVAYERTMGTKWSNPMEVMSWAADMALLFALEAALGAVIRGSLPDDEEDPFLWLAKETGLSVMGTIPFVRDAASGLQGFGSGGAQGSVIDLGFARPAIALSSAVADGEFTRKTATSMIDAGGVFFNLPSAQVNRFIKAAFDEDLNPSDASPVDWLGFGQGDGQTIFEYLGSN